MCASAGVRPHHPSPRSPCCYDHPARRAVPTARIAGGRCGGGGGARVQTRKPSRPAGSARFVTLSRFTALRPFVLERIAAADQRGVLNTALSRGKLARARHLQPSLQAAAGTVPAALYSLFGVPAHWRPPHNRQGTLTPPSRPTPPQYTSTTSAGTINREGAVFTGAVCMHARCWCLYVHKVGISVRCVWACTNSRKPCRPAGSTK